MGSGVKHSKKIATEAVTPASDGKDACVPFLENPLSSTWCHLSQASGGLQSLQILILAIVAGVAIVRGASRWRAPAMPLLRSKITKLTVVADTGRLTTISRDLADGYFVGGFSGVVHHITKATVSRSSKADFGLIRSSLLLRDYQVLLVGGDDGILHALDLRTWRADRVGSFGAAIYALCLVAGSKLAVGLGSGDLVVCDVQKSPGQDVTVVRELNRSHRHSGSIFEVVSARAALLSVGADGVLVGANTKNNRKSFEIRLSGETLWSVAELDSDRYVVACNDGNVIAATRDHELGRRRVHTASIRYLVASPRGRWCITVGKDRAIYAVASDLSAAILLHRARDYIYRAVFSQSGQVIALCDGAGELTAIDLGVAIDDLSVAELEAKLR